MELRRACRAASSRTALSRTASNGTASGGKASDEGSVARGGVSRLLPNESPADLTAREAGSLPSSGWRVGNEVLPRPLPSVEDQRDRSEKSKRVPRFMSPKSCPLGRRHAIRRACFYLLGTSFRYTNHEQEALTGERTSRS
jgi:hypothetical protein